MNIVKSSQTETKMTTTMKTINPNIATNEKMLFTNELEDYAKKNYQAPDLSFLKPVIIKEKVMKAFL